MEISNWRKTVTNVFLMSPPMRFAEKHENLQTFCHILGGTIILIFNIYSSRIDEFLPISQHLSLIFLVQFQEFNDLEQFLLYNTQYITVGFLHIKP